MRFLNWKGYRFKSTSTIRDVFELRGLSVVYLMLLESLLNTIPKLRPSSDRILRIIHDGKVYSSIYFLMQHRIL